MKKNKIISIIVFLIISIAAAVFSISKNEKDTVTENDVKRMVKKEFGIDIEIIDSYITHPPDAELYFTKKDMERYDYIGRKAKVKTKGNSPMEFEVEVFKFHGKPLKIIGDGLYKIKNKKTP